MELEMLKNLKKEVSYQAGKAINFTTGQKKLIEEYRKAKHNLALAIDNEQDLERKRAMRAEYEKITEESVTKTHDKDGRLIGYEIDFFNPHKPLQKGKLSKKVTELNKVQNTGAEK